DPAKTYEFVNNGKILFLATGKLAWGYDAATGEKKWDLKVDDYNKKGPHQLVGDDYIVANDDKVQSYSAITGKLNWEKEFKDIDQDDFHELSFLNTTAVLRYGKVHIGVDMKTGNELWRQEISYNQKALEKAGYNYSVIKSLDKMIVFTNDETIDIYDVKTGNRLARFEDCEPNYDVAAKGKDWDYRDSTDRYQVYLLDGKAVLIDLQENKMLVNHEMKIDEDRVFFVPTKYGVAVIGKNEVANFRFAAGTTASIPMDVSSYRSFFAFNNVGGKDIALISMEDNFLAVDMSKDKILWQTNSPEEIDDGYAHRLLKLQGDNAIFTLAVSSMGKRNQMKVVSINLINGKINYAHLVAKSDNYIPGLSRALDKLQVKWTNPNQKPSNSTGKGMRTIDPGYDNIGITYDNFEYNGNVVIALHTKANMRNPETGDRGGEGFFAFNPSTGAIAYKDYFRCADEGKGGLDPKVIKPQDNVVSNGKGVVFMPGEECIIGFDLNSGKRIWTQDKLEAKPISLALIDGTLYVQLGTQDYDVVLQKNSIKFAKYNDDDPYGFAAIDPATGNIIWKIETKQTVGVNQPDFSIMNYYNPKTKQLYISDEEKLYALKLTRESKGAFDWSINLDDSKIGEMPYKKTYAVTETFIGTKPSTHTTSTYIGGGYTLETTSTYGGVDPEKQLEYLDETGSAELSTVYTSFWGNIWGVSARRCLRIVAADGKILALGTKGASLLDAASGKPIWEHEWEYDQDAVQYVPRIIGNKIVYCMDRQLACMDVATGKVSWQTKEGKKAKYFTSPDDKYLFSINEEIISGYELK
ncbi:MAG TPA: PQQ-binding-like beta-propeller repeat protein, partial [Candidatus Kapabacteria bacterium]|nr:PQQ-binding-like beta-propeller repeat protein [Candidatus Kapabacteria bacterium]